MKVLLSINNSLFKKVFVLTLVVGVLPIGLSWLYFFSIRVGSPVDSETTIPVVFYGLLLLAVFVATLGAYYFSKHISRPITEFTKSATEIARGNFSQKVSVKSQDEIGRLARIFNYMVTELRRLNEMNLNRIINEKNKTETILKNIADGVIVTDSQNKIMLMNFVAEKWFGLSGQNVENQPVDIISNPDLISYIGRIAKKTQPQHHDIEVNLEPIDGWKAVVLQARSARIVGDRNKLIGNVTVLRDITREKEVNRMKTELVSMVAHELRSPLTSISGFSELLLDPELTSAQSVDYASIILDESNRLNDLITKFLDISKIEAGKSQLRKGTVDMKMLVGKVLDFNAALPDRKRIKVAFDAPEAVSTIQADRDMIEQAVLNLFSNAVKYSPEEARVTLRLKEGADALYLEVEDTGYGISEEALPKIFNKFYRIEDNEQVRDTRGSGLGLSLVKEIVEIHGGKITVSSVLEQGSTFTLWLPKKADRSKEEHDRSSTVVNSVG